MVDVCGCADTGVSVMCMWVCGGGGGMVSHAYMGVYGHTCVSPTQTHQCSLSLSSGISAVH